MDETTLLDLVEGRLSDESERERKHHLDACAECFQVFAAMARVHPSEPPPSKGVTRGTSLGRYQLLSILGAGGMGIVYAAYDPKLERKIALKRLHRLADAAQEAHLAHEARAMAKAAHPNVVAVYDVDAVGDQSFVAMELVDGSSLSTWLRESKPSASTIVATFVEAGRGLAAAHAVGLVHGDFKPENVIVGMDGRPRVTDFGRARMLASAAAAASPAGTPGYMAPELWRGQAPDAASDQFAFAVALWQALFPDEEALLPRRHLRKSESRWWSTGPARIRAALARALSVDPSERFASMDELLDALREREARARRTIAWAVLGAITLAVGFFAGTRAMKKTLPPPCSMAAEIALADAWGAPQKAAVRGRVLATSLPAAATIWSAIEERLDGWSAEWKHEYARTCEATRAAGDPGGAPADLTALRVACLEQHRVRLEALSSRLADGNTKVIEHAIDATEELPLVAECADAQTLNAGIRPPPKEIAARVLATRKKLAEVHVLHAAGNFAQSMPIADTALAESRGLSYAPVEAEALLARGSLGEDQQGDSDRAEALLKEAAETAQAAGYHKVAAVAYMTLVERYAVNTPSRREDGYRWDRYAASSLDRVFGHDDLKAKRLMIHSKLLYTNSRLIEALDEGELALAILRKYANSNPMMLAYAERDLTYIYIALDRLREAHDSAAAALDLATATLGATSGALPPYLQALAKTFIHERRYAEALEPLHRALSLGEASNGPSYQDLSWSLTDLVVALLPLGRLDEAGAFASRARDILERAGHTDTPRYAAVIKVAARVSDARGRQEEAYSLYGKACAIYEKAKVEANYRLANCLIDRAIVRTKFPGRSARREAVALARRSLAIRTAIPAHQEGLGHALYAVACMEMRAGSPKAAIEPLERAIERVELDQDQNVANTQVTLGMYRLALGRALWASRVDPARAMTLGRQARDVFAAIGDKTRHDEAVRWITEPKSARLSYDALSDE